MKVEEIKLAFETNVQFALIDDLKKEVDVFKKDLSDFVQAKRNFNDILKKIKASKQKSFDTALKYNFAVNDLGLKAMDNPIYKDFDKLLMDNDVKIIESTNAI